MASNEPESSRQQSSKSHNSATKTRTGKSGKSGGSGGLSERSSGSKNHRPSGQLYETADGQPAAIAEEDHEKENALGNEPVFSLANPVSNKHPMPQNQLYEDPEYRTYNPRYAKVDNQPLWSLAQPLPRVIRPGMRLGKAKDGKGDIIATETEEATGGDSETPQAQDGPGGVEEEIDEEQERPEVGNFFTYWGKFRDYFREALAEWLGATIAITIGLCSTLSMTTSQGQAGTYETQSWAWGFAFMLSIYITGGISGGHLNPAVTISLSVYRGFPSRRCFEYVTGQVLGGLVAGAVAYGLYHDAIFNAASVNQETPGRVLETGLYTMPKPFVHPVTGFFTEFVGTGIFVCTILALGDHTNAPPGAGMQAFIIGILVSLLCMALGYTTGGCFNPARDFGPRLVALMAGYGGHLFTEKHAWWVWGPWVADIFGGLFGAFMYDMFIFTGGESPVNYPPGRVRRALRIETQKLRGQFGRNRPHDNQRDIEAGVPAKEGQ